MSGIELKNTDPNTQTRASIGRTKVFAGNDGRLYLVDEHGNLLQIGQTVDVSLFVAKADLGLPENPPVLNQDGYLETPVILPIGGNDWLEVSILPRGALAVLLDDNEEIIIGMRVGDGMTAGGIDLPVKQVSREGLAFYDEMNAAFAKIFVDDGFFNLSNSENQQAGVLCGRIECPEVFAGLVNLQKLQTSVTDFFLIANSVLEIPNPSLFIRLNASIPRSIEGLSTNTDFAFLINVSSNNLEFVNQSENAGPNDRFICNTGNNIVAPPNGMVICIRDHSLARYRIALL